MPPKGVIPDPASWKKIVDTVRDVGRNRATRKARRMPRRRQSSGSSTTATSVGGNGSPYTTCEYDAATGVVLNYFDRGKSRNSSDTTHELDVLYTTAGKLATVGGYGQSPNNTQNAIASLYDPTDASKVWDCNRGAITATTQPTSVGLGRGIIEASDGYIWAAGIGGVYRIDPSDGTVTHRSIVSSGAHGYLFMSTASGSVIQYRSPTVADYLALINSSGTAVATLTINNPSGVHSFGSVIVKCDATTLTTYDNSNLTQISTRTQPPTSGNWAHCVTDGSTVWALDSDTTTKIFAYPYNDLSDGANIFTTNLTFTTGVRAALLTYSPIDGYLYLSQSGSVRKINPTTGGVTWTASNIQYAAETQIGFGSDFVVISNSAAVSTKSVWCLEASTGTVRWYDIGLQTVPFLHGAVHVTSDDRIFVTSSRQQP